MTWYFRVGVLRAYLNRGDLVHDLGKTARQIAKARERSELAVVRSVSTLAPGFRQRELADPLSDGQGQAIVSAFESGTPRWRLAERWVDRSELEHTVVMPGYAEEDPVIRGSGHTPSSSWLRRGFWTKACPALITRTQRSYVRPRIGRSHAVSQP